MATLAQKIQARRAANASTAPQTAPEATQPVQPQNNTVVVSGWPMATADAVWQAMQAQATPTAPTEPTAPVAPTAQPTALEATPVQEAKPVEQPSVQQPLDYQTSEQARLQEVLSNLNQSFQTNPELFADRDLFNRNFEYNKRSATQRRVLDAWYGQNITKRQEANALVTKTANDIATSYKSWLVNNQDLATMQATDPLKHGEVVAEIQRTNVIDRFKDLLYAWTPQEDNKMNIIAERMLQTLDIAKTPSIYAEYRERLNAPEIKELQSELADKEWAIKEIDRQINATRREIEEQFKNSWIWRGRLSAIMQDQVWLLQEQRNALGIEYQTIADKYNNTMSLIQTELQIAEKEAEENARQEAMTMQKYQLAYGIYSDMQKREDNFRMADMEFVRGIEKMTLQQEMEIDMLSRRAVKELEVAKGMDKIRLGDINSDDQFLVDKAIERGVTDIMTQYDWLILSSSAQLIERVKADMRAGRSYADSINGIMQDVRSKPEFRQYMNNKAGLDNRPQQFAEWLFRQNGRVYTEDAIRIANGLDPKAVEANRAVLQQMRASGALSSVDDPWFVQKFLSWELRLKNWTKVEIWAIWGQCGAFVNQLTGFGFRDSIESKINVTKNPDLHSPVPIIWGAVVIDNGSKATLSNGTVINAGHVGIVTAVDPVRWTFDYIDSNGKAWKERIGMNRGIKPNDKHYFTVPPTKRGALVGAWQEAKEQTQTAIDSASIIAFNDTTLRRKLTPEQINQIAWEKNRVMRDPNASITDILRFSQWWAQLTQSQTDRLSKFETTLWQLSNMEKDLKWQKTWPAIWRLRSLNPFDTDAQVLKAQLTALIPWTARGIYGEVWVLTDADVRLYAQTLPNLKSTAEVNKWVTAMTLEVIAWWYKSYMRTLAWSDYNVSWLEWTYMDLINRANTIRTSIWMPAISEGTSTQPQQQPLPTSPTAMFWQSFLNQYWIKRF